MQATVRRFAPKQARAAISIAPETPMQARAAPLSAQAAPKQLEQPPTLTHARAAPVKTLQELSSSVKIKDLRCTKQKRERDSSIQKGLSTPERLLGVSKLRRTRPRKVHGRTAETTFEIHLAIRGPLFFAETMPCERMVRVRKTSVIGAQVWAKRLL